MIELETVQPNRNVGLDWGATEEAATEERDVRLGVWGLWYELFEVVFCDA